jgi:predicted DNA-binding transcriptional regulator AlpA
MQHYYTTKEAIKKLGIPRNIFYELVKANEIPRVIVPSKKKAFYSKQRIDEVAEQRAMFLGEVEQTPDRFVFVLPQRGDLEQLVDIERMFFHEAIIVPPEEQQKQLTYNPEAIHVLKDTKTNMVVGGTSISPIKPEVLEKLIRLEIDETQIKPEDFCPYTTGTPLDCYIIDFAVRPGLISTYYGRKLLRATLDYFIELLNRGVIIRCLFTSAITKDGERLAKQLHFTRLQSDWTREHEDFRHSYVLDLEHAESSSRIVKRYLKQKRNLESRRKRNKKQRQARLYRKKKAYLHSLKRAVPSV